MYRHSGVPRYDRIQGFEFLSDWYLLAWDTLVDEVGMQKAEEILTPDYCLSGRAAVLNLKEWGVVDSGLDSVLQAMAFIGQHSSSGRYELQRAGEIGVLRKGSCLVAYSRHRFCHVRCDGITGVICEELLPTHESRLLATIYDGNPTCLFMIAPKGSKVTPLEMSQLKKTTLEPLPISEAFREKLVSNYLYETWLIMMRALHSAIGVERAEALLSPSMRRLGQEYSTELAADAGKLGNQDLKAALAVLFFTRLNCDVTAPGASQDSIEVSSCPFIGQERTICSLVHSFASGLVESDATSGIHMPNAAVLNQGPCSVRIR
jgi:hypothetical protein